MERRKVNPVYYYGARVAEVGATIFGVPAFLLAVLAQELDSKNSDNRERYGDMA